MTDIEKRKLLWGGIDNTTIPTMNAEKEGKIKRETGKQGNRETDKQGNNEMGNQ